MTIRGVEKFPQTYEMRAKIGLAASRSGQELLTLAGDLCRVELAKNLGNAWPLRAIINLERQGGTKEFRFQKDRGFDILSFRLYRSSRFPSTLAVPRSDRAYDYFLSFQSWLLSKILSKILRLQEL